MIKEDFIKTEVAEVMIVECKECGHELSSEGCSECGETLDRECYCNANAGTIPIDDEDYDDSLIHLCPKCYDKLKNKDNYNV